MNKTLFTFSLLIFSTISILAQTQATTNDGKKVILHDDGTWEYVEIPSDKMGAKLECDDLISTETDKMTGKSSTASKKTLIISDDGGKNGFGIFLMESSNSIILSIQAVGAGSCIDDDDKMNILFRDGTRLELVNNGKFNCKAKFTLYFGGSFGKKKQLEMLRTREIETMRIWTSKSYVEKDFNSIQSKQLMKMIDCLSNQ